jgi:hypothetical protein
LTTDTDKSGNSKEQERKVKETRGVKSDALQIAREGNLTQEKDNLGNYRDD